MATAVQVNWRQIYICRQRNWGDRFLEIFTILLRCASLQFSIQRSFLLSGWFPFLEEIYNTVLFGRPQDQESINPRLAAWARVRYSYFVFSRARCIVRCIVRSFVAVYIRSSREWKFDSSKQIVLPVGAVGPCGERSHLGITSQDPRSPSMFSTQGFPGIQIIPCLQ